MKLWSIRLVVPVYGLLQLSVAQDGITSTFDSRIMTYPQQVKTKPNSYIIELDSNDYKLEIVSSKLKSISSQCVISKQYQQLFNGVSITCGDNIDSHGLLNIPGVKRIWPTKLHTYPELPEAIISSDSKNNNDANTTFYLHRATGVEQAKAAFSINGKGVKIGIIDTGVDYNHPELGACWKTEGCIWQRGWDFVGDEYSPNQDSPILRPGPFPKDCLGHGTHVAGIIGATGPLVQGVATGASLGMYRVFSCEINGTSSSSDDVILAALEAAYEDGNDIISMSLGSTGWKEDPLSIVCSILADRGIIVVAANGNYGESGMFTSSSPALGRGVISVGSVDNWNSTGPALIISTPQGTKRTLISGSSDTNHTFFFEEPVLVEAPVDNTGSSLGCNSYNIHLENKIALIKRGSCDFGLKATHAEEAGAIGVVFYNNDGDIITPSLDKYNISIPVTLVSADDGKYIIDGLSNGNVTITAPKGEYLSVPKDNGGIMSVFSSFGPSPELEMAPFVSAPGGGIFSTYLLKSGGYASLSGTSMATPYISGAIALIKQARPSLSVDDIKSMLFTSAKPIKDQKTGLYISPYWSGSGLVNVFDAISSRATVNPPSIIINNTELQNTNNTVYSTTHVLSISNMDPHYSMYVTLENMESDAISAWNSNGSFTLTPRVWPEGITVTDYKPLVSPIWTGGSRKDEFGTEIPKGQTYNISVIISAPSTLEEKDKWFYGGFLNFTMIWNGDLSSKQHHVVPYGGFKADFRKVDVLADPSEGYPKFINANNINIGDISRYSTEVDSPLYIKFKLNIPSSAVYLKLVDMSDNIFGYIGHAYFLARNLNSNDSRDYSSEFNGSVSKDINSTQLSDVPSGSYYIRLDALRPFGNENNLEDFQTWKSAIFNYTRG